MGSAEPSLKKQFTVVNQHGRFIIAPHPRFGFWQVRPQPSRAFLERYYRLSYRNPTYSFHEELYVHLLRQHCPDLFRRRVRALEIGCGRGNFLLGLKHAGLETYGFEPGAGDHRACGAKGLSVWNSPFDLRRARQHAPYGLISLVGVLEHFPQPVAMLTQVSSLLAANGVLFVLVPNDFNPFQEAFVAKSGQHRWFLGPPEHLNYFTPSTLQRLLVGCGFSVIHRTTRFPIDMFLLMGHNYIAHPRLGKPVHLERVEFEKSFLGGREDVLWRFYDALAQADLGREIICICRRSRTERS